MLLYAELIAVFFLIKPILKKSKPVTDLCILILTVGNSVALTHLASAFGGTLSIIIGKISELFIYLPNMLIGYFFTKYEFFTKLTAKICPSERKAPSLLISGILLVLSFTFYMLLRSKIGLLYQDYYLVPAFVVAFTLIIRTFPDNSIRKAFVLLGKYSVWLWLIHGVFIKYLHNIVYAPKYPIAVFLLLLILVTPAAALTEFISRIPGLLRKKASKNKELKV